MHRVPISRVPPLNGQLELRWRAKFGLWLGANLNWATAQTRLALSDVADIRIPDGGTPGFAVIDLRAGYRLGKRISTAVALVNLLDQPYRYHGSSVNGPGRSIDATIEAAF